MSSIATNHGLTPGSEPEDLTAWYLIINALWAYAFSSARGLKMLQAQLERLKRNEAAHANSMDHFPVFATALVLAKVAGLPTADVNFAALAYTGLRFVFWGNYVFSATFGWAALRPLFWWGSNIVCLRLIWRAGKVFNGVA